MTAASDALRPAVVLVADRTLSADYSVLFEGIFGTMQTTTTPQWLMRRLVSPPMPTDDTGRARAVPLGLRRVEAALLAGTALSEPDVVCTTPEALPRLLGPWTKIVGVSSADPLGCGMSNTTTLSFCGGRLYTAAWTDHMMAEIARAKDRFDFAVVAGGAGAWQWAADPLTVTRHGIDVVFEGAFEAAGPDLFSDLLDGRTGPGHIRETETCVDRVRPIRAASLMGAVELSRGCGNGCRFCTSSASPMAHLPVDTIVADLKANVAAGARSVVVGSEDFFRYGADGSTVDFEALRGLLEEMNAAAGKCFMQLDHGNICSVLQLDDDQLREIRRLLVGNVRTDYPWVNLGIESASGRLVAAGGPGKLGPFDPADWPEMVHQAARRLNDCGLFPVFSIVLGLPGETPRDIADTLQLVRGLATGRCVVFPIFYVPTATDDTTPAFTLDSMRDDHLQLFSECYELNFRRVPRLFWDNQAAGGVSWPRRLLFQAFGRGEVLLWRRRFARLAKRIARGAPAVQVT